MKNPAFSESDNYLILGAKMKNFTLTEGFKAYQTEKEDEVFVPLSDLMNAFEFPIYVNSETGIAKGWFMKENRKFNLDMKSGKLSVDGKHFDLTEDDVVWGGDDLYIRSSFLPKIFPLEAELDLSDSNFDFTALEPFPFEEKIAREKRQKMIRKGRFNTVSADDYIESEENFTWPFLDLGITFLNQETRYNETNTLAYTLSGNQILFGLDTAMNFYGNTDRDDKYARINMSRYKPKGDFMGFAKFFEMGDINSYDMDLISAPVSGRGVNISTFDEKGNSTQRDLKLQGMLTQGWDVEVYRNNILTDFSTGDSTGLYAFDDLTLDMGLNKFRLIFYGPQGETREEERAIYLSPTSVKGGELSYRLFAQEDAMPAIALNDQKVVGNRIGFYTEYGISDSISLTSGAVVFSPKEDLAYVQERSESRGMLGLKTGFSIFRLGLSTAFGEGSDNPAISGLFEANFSNLNFYIDHSEFNGLKSEKSYLDTKYLKDISHLHLRGRLKIPWVGALPFHSRFTEATSIEDEAFKEWVNTLSFSWWRFYLSLESRYRMSFAGSKENFGTSYLNFRLGRATLRGEARYDFKGEHLERTSLGLDWRGIKKLTLQTKWLHTQDLNNNTTDSYLTTLSRRFSFGTISASYTWNTEDEKTISLSYNTSVLHNPSTGEIFISEAGSSSQGALVATSYLDANYNGIKDEEEELVSNVDYNLNSSSEKSRETDPQYKFTKGLSPYQLANIKMNDQSLGDISYYSKTDFITVMPRPGVATKIDFPVVQLGSIDGEIKLVKGEEQKPIKGIRLLLFKGEEKVAESISDVDGYYTFEKLQPDTYTIHFDEDQMAILELKFPETFEFIIEKETVFQTLETINIESIYTEDDSEF